MKIKEALSKSAHITNPEEFTLSVIKYLIRGTEYENRVYLVGGAVRDEIMGHKPKDLDFVIDGDSTAGIDFSKTLGDWLKVRTVTNPKVYKRYGTASLLIPKKNRYNIPEMELEFVAPRREVYADDSRNPDVTPGDLLSEITRRDLTINSLLKNISTNEILDLTGRGIFDIKHGIIRTPVDADETFKDDPLRMLRAVRFANKYSFTMLPEIVSGIIENAVRINLVSDERVTIELEKILLSDTPKRGFNMLNKVGLLKRVFRDLHACIGVTQNEHHQHDVFDHILEVVEKTPNNKLSRLIAIFHDIGKVKTRTVSEDGKIHFYEHERIGMDMTGHIMRDFRYKNSTITQVKLGVRNHMMLKHAGDDCSKLSKSSLRKFLNRVDPILDNLLDVIHADNCSHTTESSMPNQIENIRSRIEELKKEDTTIKIKLPINGDDIMKMGIKPGPVIKAIKKELEDLWYANPNITVAECETIVLKYLNQK